MAHYVNSRSLIKAGILIGAGMGGFLDGILFHQVFQIHNMLSSLYFPDTLAKAQLNMVWDGFFHALTWTTTAVGIKFLWAACQKAKSPLSGRTLAGSIFLGAGLFNFVEGLVDHQVLQVHHVVERASSSPQLFWDMMFLLSGLVMIGGGIYYGRLLQKPQN